MQFASVDTLNYHKEQFNKCFLCLYRNYTNWYSIIDSSLTNGRNQHSCCMIIQCGLETKTKNKRFHVGASCFISGFWKIPYIANAEGTPWRFQVLSVWFWPNMQFTHRRSYFCVNNLPFGLLIVNNLKKWEHEPPLVEFKAECWILEKI